MSVHRVILAGFELKFAEIRSETEKAIGQLDSAAIRRSLDGDTNSVAVTMKHVGGNLRSRFTNFLTEDGERHGAIGKGSSSTTSHRATRGGNRRSRRGTPAGLSSRRLLRR